MSLLVEDFVARLGWEVDSRQLTAFQRSSESLRRSVVRGAQLMTAAFVGVGYGIKQIMGAFSVFENAEARFQPMMGSLERSRMLVERLKEEAATTPFQFEQLANISSQMLPLLGGNTEETIKWMRVMGDMAGGNIQRMESLTRATSRVFIEGKATKEAMNILTEGAGIPIFQEIAKTMNIDQTKVFDQLRRGKVTLQVYQDTLKRMTSQGGMYFEGMKIASVTLDGRISTLKDTMVNAFGDIGRAMAPTVKGLVEDAIKLGEALQKWAKANDKLIKQKFVSFVRDLREVLGWIVSAGKTLLKLTDSLGGLANTLKLVAIGFAAIKIAPVLHSLTTMLATVPSLTGALKAAGGSLFSSWAPWAGLIAGAYLVLDDINAGKIGGDSYFGDMLRWLEMNVEGFNNLTTAQQDFARHIQKNITPFGSKGIFDTITGGLGLAYEYVEDFLERTGDLFRYWGEWIWDHSFGWIWNKLYDLVGIVSQLLDNISSGMGDRFKNFRAELAHNLKGTPLPIASPEPQKMGGVLALSSTGIPTFKQSIAPQEAGAMGSSIKRGILLGAPSININVRSEASANEIARVVTREIGKTFTIAVENTGG